MPVLVLNTCMDADMQFMINSFKQIFPARIFSLTFPWFLIKSLTFPWQLSNSLAFPGFPDKWSSWNSGYRLSRANIMAQGLSTPDPSLSPTHLSIRRGCATTTHFEHNQVSLTVSRNTTLVPSLGLHIGPACEAGLIAGMWRERVPTQRRKKESPGYKHGKKDAGSQIQYLVSCQLLLELRNKTCRQCYALISAFQCSEYSVIWSLVCTGTEWW